MSDGQWLMVVDAEVDPEVEQAWNAWYDAEHIPSILGCPHFRSARRYRAASHGARYITVYEVSGPECTESEEFARRRGWGSFSAHVRARVEVFELIAEAPSAGTSPAARSR
jgi:hypothetical protein